MLVQTLPSIKSLNHRRRLEISLHEMSTDPSRLKCLLNSIEKPVLVPCHPALEHWRDRHTFSPRLFGRPVRQNTPRNHDRQCLVSKREHDSFKKLFPKQPPWRYVPKEILVPCHKGMACRTRLLSPERMYIIRKCPKNCLRSWKRRPAF